MHNGDGVSDKKKQKIERDATKLTNKMLRKKAGRVGAKKAVFMMMRMMQKANMMSGFAYILRGMQKEDIMNKDWLNVLVRGTNGEWEEQEDSRRSLQLWSFAYWCRHVF